MWGVHSINSGSWRVQEYQCSVGCAFYKLVVVGCRSINAVWGVRSINW